MKPPPYNEEMREIIDGIITGSTMLAGRNHGALIVLQRFDDLTKYAHTGVLMDTIVTPETLLQIFYPNTPLHDGAVIIAEGRIKAAACIMPLSSRNVLDKTPSRQMGLRHRAALGISEMNDSVTIVISEESGTISLAYDGKITRDISPERLRATLTDFYKIPEQHSFWERLWKFLSYTVKKLFGKM